MCSKNAKNRIHKWVTQIDWKLRSDFLRFWISIQTQWKHEVKINFRSIFDIKIKNENWEHDEW